MRRKNIQKFLMPLLIVGIYNASYSQETVNRESIPIPNPKPEKITELDVRNVEKPEIYLGATAPQDAPNVLVILIDDFGFGQGSTFGGPVEMPTLDALAEEGLKYNQFHTNAISSATRTSLLTGRSHHLNNMGTISESATSYPGYTGMRPNDIAAIPKILKYNGYATAMFGKNHEIPAWQSGPAGDQTLWPSNVGFEKFYGFFGGETDQFQPVLVDGVTRIETPRTDNYHFTTDMADKAIEWIKMQHSYNPDKPFFAYFATGATHAPHQAPKEWVDKYKGKFDQGWDEVRNETYKRQLDMGVIPQGTKLTPMPDHITKWDTLNDKEKAVYAKQMEVFAGFGSHADYEAGRVIDAIKEIGEYDNTLIFYIAGDNGASPEGMENGSLNSLAFYNKVPEKVEDVYNNRDKLGTRESFGHYARAWAYAGDAPFKWSKVMASDFGGTRNGMVISWPKGIKKGGELREQWSHVTDITPTILEAANIAQPKVVDGVTQIPIQGESLVYSFNDKNAKTRHNTQYFEVGGNRAIYNDGWLARVIHIPLDLDKPYNTLENDVWELYDTTKDFSLSTDVASQYPDKLAELKKLFDKEAVANHVYPLDDRTVERLNSEVAGRPDALGGRKSLTLYSGSVGIPENSFINIKNSSYEITSEINVEGDPSSTNGVVIAQGGDYGGWSLFVKNGVPMHEYNYLGYKRTLLTGNNKLQKGKNELKYVFKYDENGEGGKGNPDGIGKGGNGYLYLNGTLIGKAKVPDTVSTIFSFDDGAAVGEDDGGRASTQYEAPFRFNENIKQVKIDLTK